MDAKPDLEQDLYHCSWMPRRVEHDDYAQLLYAALCNNRFQKVEVWPVLRGDTWSCTWRSAGSIVAELRGEGDYMDWYCSGIFGAGEADSYQGYVSEGTVTDEIRQDLFAIGWTVEPYPEDKKIQ